MIDLECWKNEIEERILDCTIVKREYYTRRTLDFSSRGCRTANPNHLKYWENIKLRRANLQCDSCVSSVQPLARDLSNKGIMTIKCV